MASSQRMEAFMSTVMGISRHYCILGRPECIWCAVTSCAPAVGHGGL